MKRMRDDAWMEYRLEDDKREMEKLAVIERCYRYKLRYREDDAWDDLCDIDHGTRIVLRYLVSDERETEKLTVSERSCRYELLRQEKSAWDNLCAIDDFAYLNERKRVRLIVDESRRRESIEYFELSYCLVILCSADAYLSELARIPLAYEPAGRNTLRVAEDEEFDEICCQFDYDIDEWGRY